jgi:uncharacterized protein
MLLTPQLQNSRNSVVDRNFERMQQIFSPGSSALVDDFKAFVSRADFPCVGAKAALGKGQMIIEVAHDICSSWDDMKLWSGLYRFSRHYRQCANIFQSYAAIFSGPDCLSEEEFERAMWARLKSLSDKDEWVGLDTDPRVSDDPDNPHFSLSFGGEAFFVVGMHPKSSRPARCFSHPALVFNPHDQFEQLRVEGRYDKLRQSILERDEQLAGSRNPMLARHGEISEARQYSGRNVGPDWKCPCKRGWVDPANAD